MQSFSGKNRLRFDKKAKAIVVECVKSAEWLVITDPKLLSPGRQERLRQLRENNQLFADLYAVTAKLKTVWTACCEESFGTNILEGANNTAKVIKNRPTASETSNILL